MYLQHTVEVFKTDIPGAAEFERLMTTLDRALPGSEISFDAEDCDKVLRIAGRRVCLPDVSALIRRHGYVCEELE
ncbi:MAG: hypothetical protein INR69_22550 [Mucilaginibacter polytrichastri]|nr:hypothetical protein [Mucilaginibacter polytrichastri]